MGQIGEMLKAARTSKGISISQAEEDTKIRSKYLEALENETYNEIPGRIYVKGFLNNYANYLGLNSQELVQLLKETLPPEEEDKPIEFNKPNPILNEKKYRRKYRFKPKYFRYLLGILAIITLVALNTWWHNKNTPVTTNPNNQTATDKTEQINDNKKTEQSKTDSQNKDNNQNINANQNKDNSPNSDSQNKQGSQPDQQAQTNVQNQSGVHLALNADKGISWVRITVDGKDAFVGNINQGEIKNFDGNDKITVRFGNSGAINVTFNGKSLGYLGEMGQVVDKDFTPTTNNQ